MGISSSTIQRIKEQYTTWWHVLVWLGLIVNCLFVVFAYWWYSSLFTPLLQGLYVFFFIAYVKCYKTINLIALLLIASCAWMVYSIKLMNDLESAMGSSYESM